MISGKNNKGDKGYSLSYTVWCSGEHELYDLITDVGQMDNLLLLESTTTLISGLGSVASLAARLDALLFVLKSCKGETCVKPWKALHTRGDVENLKQAMEKQFDAFYEQEQLKVRYSRCEMGYLLDAEGPQFESDGVAYNDLMFKDGVEWSEWV